MTATKLSDFIRDNIQSILHQWEQVAKDIPAARHMDIVALRNDASGMLYAIADDLDQAQSLQEQAQKSKGRGLHSVKQTYAGMHGTSRMAAGFSINETMSEFRALRASVVLLWTESSGATPSISDEGTRFHEAIDQALTESIEQYSRLFDTLLSSSPDIHGIFGIDGRYIYANKSLSNLYGGASSGIVGKNLHDLGSAVASEIQPQLQQVANTKMTYIGEMPYLLPHGKATFEYIFVPVVSAEGKVEAIAATARDITKRKALEETHRINANYDGLTGLANRSLFQVELEREVKRSARSGLAISLLFIDLDGFKEVNDRMGHAAGDEILQQAGQRIRSCVRNTDTAARIGGDEFTVIMAEVNKVIRVEILARKILDELAKPFLIQKNNVHISGSIGITLFPQDAATPEDMIRNADLAMYEAKKAGRNRFSFYTVGMRESAWARLKVIDALRNALPQHQFTVYYQPIVDLLDERIVKAEALLRWNHPQDGLVFPGEFIELAEEIGLISEIDNWVLDEAVVRTREWSTLLGVPFQISVNKSPVEFMSKAPMRMLSSQCTLSSQLAALGVARNNITVEITEGVLLIDSPSVRERLDNLQKAGIQLAIDDFGTGHSSIAYLKKFHVHYLKIDQSFVQDMTTSMDSRTIAEAIIVMAHKLGLKVIAEGVETVEQKEWLKAAECDYAQGYLFSKPVSSQDFEKMLNMSQTQHEEHATKT
ncbi:MAG: putative bifunctional diguanylate cyclase/phosphodiesterase [Burkholderiaceae bacterium]